jgi:hypothetical protein
VVRFTIVPWQIVIVGTELIPIPGVTLGRMFGISVLEITVSAVRQGAFEPIFTEI